VLASVVTKANERGIRIRSIDIREPNLEAVFLNLTGRALRD
jgi:ABC-2 type transport system ATP-binding protein